MNTRGWLGALTLGLGGWLSGTSAETAWRPVTRPLTPVRVARASAEGPALGSPVAPRPFPALQQTVANVPALGEHVPAGRVYAPGTVIASSVPPKAPTPAPASVEPSAQPWQSDLFAMDRVVPVGGPIRPVASFEEPPPAAEGRPGVVNWAATWPVGPPDPVEPPPGPPLLFGGDLPPPRWYLVGEYLLWWTKADQAPVLVTTGDAQGGRNTNAGFLGRPDTVILHDGRLDHGTRQGARFYAGVFLDDCGSKALEVGGFFLGSSSSRFTANSAQFPVLTRPFFAVDLNRELGQFVAFPGASTGRVTVEAPSELWGLEANLNCKWCCGCDYRINGLAGARFLRLRESLTITEDIQNLPGGPDPFNGTRILFQDRFTTTNEFYGGQVGVEGRWQRGRVTVDGRAKVALGVTHQVVDINGFAAFPPNTPGVEPLPGALLTTRTNIGRYSRDRFAVVPELGASVGYFLTERLRASVGYNFLYWSSVVRPGGQIDRGLNTNFIPNFTPRPGPFVPTPRPAVLLRDTDFWAQGLTIGLEYRY